MSGSRTKALRRELRAILGRSPTKGEERRHKADYKKWRRS